MNGQIVFERDVGGNYVLVTTRERITYPGPYRTSLARYDYTGQPLVGVNSVEWYVTYGDTPSETLSKSIDLAIARADGRWLPTFTIDNLRKLALELRMGLL